MKDESFRPNRMLSYFQEEWKILFFVTVSGLIYNLGLLAGPWFEGKMTGKLVDLLGGTGTFHQMLMLVTAYVVSIGIVQVSRYFKRFYVRRFANNVNRHMKQILYGTLVRKSRLELEAEGTGNILTKAILDVDDCVEGMRKFTTEIFDTGVALLAYACMLLWYDWRLALLCMIFPPISYVIAEKMKVMVQKTGAAYKVQSGALSAATLDRATNAITYRVFGCEEDRKAAYEENLSAYEICRCARQYLEHSYAADLPYDLDDEHSVYPVFWRQKRPAGGMDTVEHRRIYHVFVLLHKACHQIIERCEAF